VYSEEEGPFRNTEVQGKLHIAKERLEEVHPAKKRGRRDKENFKKKKKEGGRVLTTVTKKAVKKGTKEGDPLPSRGGNDDEWP